MRPFVSRYSPFLLCLVLGLSGCGGGGDSKVVVTTAAQITNTSENATPTEVPNSPVETAISINCGIKYAANSESNIATVLGPDPLGTQLWHVKNTGQDLGVLGEDLNLLPAWQLSKGAGVRVALVDDALETLHADLYQNIAKGASVDYRGGLKVADPLPCDTNDYHGTAVAGIIGAKQNNGLGTEGIAPEAKLVGYNALANDTNANIADALTRDLHLNAVYNNSWGSEDDGKVHGVAPFFGMAVRTGLAQGRGGKGAIYVFASGNGGCYRINAAGQCQQDLASLDGYLNEPGLIVVAPFNHFGKSPQYGEGGANVLVSAPGGSSIKGITTTGLRNSFDTHFYGSSAAAPMVSGVVALMLSANPNLTWRDVKLILARSARQIDAQHSDWASRYSPELGLTYRFHPRYGFGAVDAAAAVRLASNWVSVGNSETMKTCQATFLIGASGTSENPGVIPDNGSALVLPAHLNAADCQVKHVEHVEVNFDANHQYSGDLDIRLVSPSGTVSQLALSRICTSNLRNQDDCGPYEQWRFASVRHLDETAQGTWQLQVVDKFSGKVGSVNAANLTVHGR